jgi:hypothetical protein
MPTHVGSTWTDKFGRVRRPEQTSVGIDEYGRVDPGRELHGQEALDAVDAHIDHRLFFEERGVDLAVRDRRPYRFWTPEDRQPLKDAWFPFLSKKGQRNWVSRVAGQSEGYIITRYIPPGLNAPSISPEIRPLNPVYTDIGHDHAKTFDGNPELLAMHLKKKHGPNDPVRPSKGATLIDGGPDVAGWHTHPAKYVHCPGEGQAKRLDMHPDAVEKFEGASRVFFGIEGCIKADALLTAGEAVFSVPSVTCWNAPELPEFVERYRLIGKRLFIVPDADWHGNWLVITQALLCVISPNARASSASLRGAWRR